MSKSGMILNISEDLKKLTTSIEALVASMDSNNKETTSEPSKEDPITIEQVRAVLAEKSQSGKQPEVKALIIKYGANKLTDVDSRYYKDLLKEAGELK